GGLPTVALDEGFRRNHRHVGRRERPDPPFQLRPADHRDRLQRLRAVRMVEIAFLPDQLRRAVLDHDPASLGKQLVPGEDVAEAYGLLAAIDVDLALAVDGRAEPVAHGRELRVCRVSRGCTQRADMQALEAIEERRPRVERRGIDDADHLEVALPEDGAAVRRAPGRFVIPAEHLPALPGLGREREPELLPAARRGAQVAHDRPGVVEREFARHDYRPILRMTLPTSSLSWRSSAAQASREGQLTVWMPRFPRASWTSGFAAILPISACRRAAMSFGTPFGAKTPHHSCVS